MSNPVARATSDLHGLAHQAGLAAIQGRHPDRVADAVDDLDRLVLLGLADHLHRHTRMGRPGAHTATDVTADLHTADRHRRIPRYWLDGLARAGLARHDDPSDEPGRFGDLYRPPRRELVDARARFDDARTALGYPPALTEMVLRSLRVLAELLRDDLGVQALLYPDGEPATADAVYRDNLINRYLNAAAAAAVGDLTAHLDEPLRALEIGAGVGATTADLLPVLAHADVERYLFTDVSPFFLTLADRRFGGGPEAAFLRSARLDITGGIRRQLAAEPAAPTDVHLVVAATVAHNARHAGDLLGQLRDLLRPSGLLVLIETVVEHPQSFTTMPFALSAAPGDPPVERTDERAGSQRTYLHRAEWRRWLERAGLVVVADLPPDGDPLEPLSQRLFVARR